MPAATTNDDIADIDEASPDPEPHSTSLSQHHFEDSDNDDQEDNDESVTYTNTELAVLQNSTSAAVLKVWQNTQVKLELLKNEKPLHGYFDDQFALGVKGVRKQGKADLADANHASLEKVKNLAAEFHKQWFTAFELKVLAGDCEVEIEDKTRPKRLTSLQTDSDYLIKLYEEKTRAETVLKMQTAMEVAQRRASPNKTIAKKKK